MAKDFFSRRPLLIGITGSIGMGKTETAKLFGEFGFPVYDSDATVHRLYGPCGDAVEPIEKAFPGSTLEGQVNRPALMAQLQSDKDGFARLEAIVHPLVAQKQREFVVKAAADGAEMAILDIPLLFETGGDRRVDVVVVASAPALVQRNRALARPGMTAAKFETILGRQMPDSEKCFLADYVVETGSGLEKARAQVRKIVAELRQKQAEE